MSSKYIRKNEAEPFPAESLRITDFEGPLDLLSYLIDRGNFNWYDIPIALITGQYLAFMQDMTDLDMELASDFLVMGATLVHIKSRMLLPDKRLGGEDEGVDPREELILQLLEYRRCKLVAGELNDRRERFSGGVMRLPSTPKDLGIKVRKQEARPFNKELFEKAVQAVNSRNTERFQDLTEKMSHLLRRETVSLPEKIRYIWRAVRKRGKVFFSELFSRRSSVGEKVTGFLALLELVRRQYVRAEQTEPFAPIELGLQDESRRLADLHLPSDLLEESAKDYD